MNSETSYRNKNRGYQQLRVWQDSIQFYVWSCEVFRKFPYELRRVASQATGEWIDHLMLKESNEIYTAGLKVGAEPSGPNPQHSNTPTLQHSNTPTLHFST